MDWGRGLLAGLQSKPIRRQTCSMRREGRHISTAFDSVPPPDPAPPPPDPARPPSSAPAPPSLGRVRASAPAAEPVGAGLVTRKGAAAARFVSRREAVRCITAQSAPKATPIPPPHRRPPGRHMSAARPGCCLLRPRPGPPGGLLLGLPPVCPRPFHPRRRALRPPSSALTRVGAVDARPPSSLQTHTHKSARPPARPASVCLRRRRGGGPDSVAS